MKDLLKTKGFQITFSFVISAIFITWIVLNVDIRDVWERLKTINYWIIVPVVVLNFIQFMIRAVRWRYLLPKEEKSSRPSLKLLLDSSMLGNFGNFVLPLRSGEFIRPLMLSKCSNVRFPIGLTSVITERFFDLSMVLILFAFMVSFFGELPSGIVDGVGKSFAEIRSGLSFVATSFSLLAIALFLFITLGIFLPEKILSLMNFCLKIVPKKIADIVLKLAKEFLAGTEPLKNIKNLLIVFSLSAIIWGLTIITYWVAFYMFSDIGSLDLWAALVLTVVLALGVATPSAPGFVGVFEISCIVAFALVCESKEMATTYAIVTHTFQYVLVISYGLYVLFSYGLHLGDLKKGNKD